MNIVAKLALGVCTIILVSGCGGSDIESDEQAVLKSTYESDFEWAVDEMVDVYDEYGIETGAWRLLEVGDVYITSANEMNGADYAVTMIIEFATKGPGDEEWVEGGWSPGCGSAEYQTYKPAIPRKIQVASWNGDRQLPCLSSFKESMENSASKQQ